MHASSLENMYLCFDRFAASAPYALNENIVVVDVGGADVNGGYRPVFSDPKFQYLTVDLTEGSGVDVVLEDPYRLPFDDNSADIVLSGQMLEHCEFFWLSFAEMVRILKPGGHIFLIAPSAGPIHRYPVDCYRFYPDAFRALAKYTNCVALDIWLDERGPWRDLVGVFAKHALPAKKPITTIAHNASYDPLHSPPGMDEEEVTNGEVPYLEVLKDMHTALAPQTYLEIGVRHGRSLSLAQGHAVGVDPAPDIRETLSAYTAVFTMTSDRFFAEAAAEALPQSPDLVFIDGMHLFEYALRDFMNVERLSAPNTIVIIDDIYPSHVAQAERDRRTRVWTGDVWKVQACLQEVRQDLLLLALNTSPTGLLLVAGLNASSRILWDHYNPTVRRFRELEAPSPEIIARSGVISPTLAAVKDALVARHAEARFGADLVRRIESIFSRDV